jgi:DNA-binding beta-propeller fold protein YncE
MRTLLTRNRKAAAGFLCAAFSMNILAAGIEAPAFEIDPSWPKIPAKYKLGDPSSIAVDAKDNIWVLHRPRTLPADQASKAAPPIMIFDQTGNFIRGWGGAGAGYEWPEREHGIHIDSKGFVWLGGNNCPARNLPGLKPVGDDQILKFTPDGKFIMQIGRSTHSKGNADTKNFHQPADAVVYAKTNELFVADGYGNHRVVVMDADTGAFKRMWGAFGNKPVDKDDCPPPSLSSVPDGRGPDQFSIVHAIRVSNDGMVYVADRENRRVQMFTLEGKFVNQLVRGSAPFARDLALSPDADQRWLYVGGGTDIVVVNRKTLEIVTTIHRPGMVGGGHQMQTDSKGNLYIAATNRGLQKLTFKGKALQDNPAKN